MRKKTIAIIGIFLGLVALCFILFYNYKEPCEIEPVKTESGGTQYVETQPVETQPGQTETGESEPGRTEEGQSEAGQAGHGETNNVRKPSTGVEISDKEAYKVAGSIFEGVVASCELDIGKLPPPRRYYLKVRIGENLKSSRTGEAELSLLIYSEPCINSVVQEVPKVGERLIFFTGSPVIYYTPSEKDKYTYSNSVFKILPATDKTRNLIRKISSSTNTNENESE